MPMYGVSGLFVDPNKPELEFTYRLLKEL